MANLPYPGYLTPAQQRAQANRSVDEALLPHQQEINRQRAEAAAAAAARQQQISGATAAEAELLKGIGPAVQQTYQTAGHDQATFAKGFSDTMRALQGDAAGQTNETLRMIGAPEGQMQNPGPGASDVLYGLGGAIPANTFAREGAAFASAANFLPATAMGRGMELLMGAQADAQKENKSFGEKLLELEAKRPGLIQDTLKDLQNQQQQQRSSFVSEQYLLNQMRQTGASITGVDPATGLPTYTNAEAQADDAAKIAAAAKAQAAKVAAGRATGRKAKTSAFNSARGQIRTSIKSDLIKSVPGRFDASKTTTVLPSYEKAMSYLWGLYGEPLMIHASGAGKKALEKQIRAMIAKQLAAFKIWPTQRATSHTIPPKKR